MPERDDKLIVKVPGSIANLGPGFDVFALALSHPLDLLAVEITKDDGVRIDVEGLSSESIPHDPKSNTAGLVARLILEKFAPGFGVKLTIHKGIPTGFGLGSSGADAAATAYALNQLLNLGLSNDELIYFASQGEAAASDATHADNVSASMLGGFTIIRSYDPVSVIRYDPPDNLGICIAIPRIKPPQKKTAHARRALPENVPLSQLVHNVGHAASLVCGMLTKDVSIVGSAMDDRIIEPIRSEFIPGYRQVRVGALKQGAVGVAICGAGPSIAAFYDTDEMRPRHISESMVEGFKAAGIDSEILLTSPGRGCRLK